MKGSNKTNIITVSVYLAFWVLSLAFFWLFNPDALGYSLLVQSVLLCTILPFGLSVFYVSRNGFDLPLIFLPITCGLGIVLHQYFTFSLKNMIAFLKINIISFEGVLWPLVPSLLGMAVGFLILKIKKK